MTTAEAGDALANIMHMIAEAAATRQHLLLRGR